jgi:hypothetical protein
MLPIRSGSVPQNAASAAAPDGSEEGRGGEGAHRRSEGGRGGEGIQGARLGGEGRRGEGVRVWLGISSHYIR